MTSQRLHTSNNIARDDAPTCMKVTPLSPDDFHAVAAGHEIEWVGPLVSFREDTWWRCRSGHKWQARYGNVRKAPGNGCPICAGRKSG